MKKQLNIQMENLFIRRQMHFHSFIWKSLSQYQLKILRKQITPYYFKLR